MNGTPTTNGRTNGALTSNGYHSSIPPRLFAVAEPPSLDDFRRLTTESKPIHYPSASSVEKNIPVYELPDHASLTSDQLSAFQDEWYHVLLSGPGVFVTKGLYKNKDLLEKVNSVYSSIIAREKEGSGQKGDHFAGSGQNDRIWNSFSKHGLEDPSSFLEYYSNPWLPTISAAWLGPHHRLTAQVNIVKPGASPQISHRDYHLGFQTAEWRKLPHICV
jgi:hypothetical protein